ncbi:MAG: class I SAM-dependent methyltransferase [Sphaerochaetaceae bacterium]|nr:class I SAM-dependent methyltransferase [Sphaerochaetaceae bacterium]
MATVIEKKDFEKLIKKNAQSMRSRMLASGTDCMRIYDRNLQVFPVTVDLYGKFAKITDYSDGLLAPADLESCKDAVHRLAYIESDKIVVTGRKKREHREQHQKSDAEAVYADVRENGLKFTCNLTTYADTGLFLDSVNARRMVMEASSGCDVLNLFSYTGAFSVYAAAGGARTVTSVDMSSTYTAWAKDNLEKNGFFGDSYPCVCKEAMKFLTEISHNGCQYDIIIFDPPCFSNSHRMEHDFDVQRDWVKWIKLLAGVLRKNGFIFFSVNLGDFRMDKRSLRGFKIKETTALFHADGFSKRPSGTVRSWVMTFDDKALSLDWSREKRRSDASKTVRGRRSFSDRSSDKGGYDRRGRYPSEERRTEERSGDSFSRRRNYTAGRERMNEHGYGRESASRGRGSDQYGYRDRDRRYREYERMADGERKRDFERFSGSSQNSGERVRNRFSDRGNDRRRDKQKPYGYDVFKPSRNRDDNPDFFWTDERSGRRKDR